MGKDPWDDVLAKRGVKHEAGGETQVVTASATEAEMADQIEARVRGAAAQRAGDIAAACALADVPERAAGFIADSSMGLSEVLAVLIRERGRPKGLSAFRQRFVIRR